MIIAFHNFKGGVGNTTLAAHTCALARACGLSVVGVSVDFKQELPRWLAGTQIDCVELDLQARADRRRSARAGRPVAHAPPLHPDVWVVPICDRLSNENAGECLGSAARAPDLARQHGPRSIVPAALARTSSSRCRCRTAGRSPSAAEEQAILWNVPELAESSGARRCGRRSSDVLRAFVAVGVPLPSALHAGP
jgi:hypothetical protein